MKWDAGVSALYAPNMLAVVYEKDYEEMTPEERLRSDFAAVAARMETAKKSMADRVKDMRRYGRFSVCLESMVVAVVCVLRARRVCCILTFFDTLYRRSEQVLAEKQQVVDEHNERRAELEAVKQANGN